MKIAIQREDFDAGAEARALSRNNPAVGAVASFVGLVRDHNDGASVSAMTLEHYPGMTEKAIAQIVDEAKGRWKIIDCTRDSPHRRVASGRPDRARRRRERASRRRLRGLRIHHGLPQDRRHRSGRRKRRLTARAGSTRVRATTPPRRAGRRRRRRTAPPERRRAPSATR